MILKALAAWSGRARRVCLAGAVLVLACVSGARAQTVGEPLPPWSPGVLDIHRISTGSADAVLYVFPDRTTLLADPGAPALNHPRSPRFTQPRPDASRAPGEWITRYVSRLLPDIATTGLDYALITHFHGDHMGGYFAGAQTAEGGYKLSGITDVGHRLPIRTLLDRAWPDGYPPIPPNEPQRLMMENYRKFLDWQTAHKGMRVERFRAGRNDQIVLRREPKKYPTFELRNIAASGEIWTGEGNSARQFLPLKEFQPEELPAHENRCSIVFRLQYGDFRYYAGGDIPGVVPEGKPSWYDVETPVAKVTGPVDVAILNHHGVRDTSNEFFIRTLRPRIFAVSYWSASHLHDQVLARLLSPETYPGPRDVFSTNMVELHQALDPNIAKLTSLHGHIVIRVAPGGGQYQVIILDDTTEAFQVTAVHGPYFSQSVP